MSDLRLRDEQREFQSLAAEFAEKEIKSLAHRGEQDASLAQEVFQKAWGIGLATVALPEELGGLGLPLFDCCVIAEEIAAGCAGLAGTIEANTLAQIVVDACGSGAQKQQYLSALAEGANIAGIDAQLFSAQTSLTYQKRGNSYVLNGTINAVANADFCQWLIAAATANGAARVFLIDKNAPSVSLLESVYQVGRKAMNLRQVQLRDLELGQDACLGAIENEKFNRARLRAFCLLAAGAVGLARSAMQHAVQYSRERKTFGQPIFQHQAVAFMLADMAKDIEAARLLVWQAAVVLDSGALDLVAPVVALANAQDVAMRVSTDAVQVYGGYGYSREYPVEKLMRDAKSVQVFQCTNLEAKLLIGRELIHR